MRDLPTTRRTFLSHLTLGASTIVAACRDATAVEPGYARLTARPVRSTSLVSPGYHALGLEPGSIRDGFLYVPRGYSVRVPAPLVVLLHGGGQSATVWQTPFVAGLMDELGVVLLAPESRAETWDFEISGVYGHDVPFIDAALSIVFERCNIRPDAITLGGFSAGASEALGLGVINGDLFSGVMSFSPGSLNVPTARGLPRVFVSHGTNDSVVDPTWTRDFIVPELGRMGLRVEFIQFDGEHTLPRSIFEHAIRSYVG